MSNHLKLDPAENEIRLAIGGDQYHAVRADLREPARDLFRGGGVA